MKYDAWGRPLECRYCGAKLTVKRGSGRPRVICGAAECVAMQKARHSGRSGATETKRARELAEVTRKLADTFTQLITAVTR